MSRQVISSVEIAAKCDDIKCREEAVLMTREDDVEFRCREEVAFKVRDKVMPPFEGSE